MPENDRYYFQPADGEHVRREKEAARRLRRSQWWKNLVGRGKCYYCGRQFHPHDLTMDHVVPIIRGGRSTRRNVVPCCAECNADKQNRLPSEWNAYLEGRLGENRDPAAGEQ